MSEQAVSPLLVSVERAAELLGVGRTLVYEMLRAGSLPSIALGRRRLVPVKGLEAFVEQLTRAQAAV